MAFQMSAMYVFDGVPCDSQQVGYVFQSHCFQQSDHVFRKTVSIAATTYRKGDMLLTVIITNFILTLVVLYFHADYHLPAANRKTDKVTHAETILHQMAASALGILNLTLFCFNMQNNCVIFVFLTGAYMVIQTPRMI